jgi:hypothetical protein
MDLWRFIDRALDAGLPVRWLLLAAFLRGTPS